MKRIKPQILDTTRTMLAFDDGATFRKPKPAPVRLNLGPPRVHLDRFAAASLRLPEPANLCEGDARVTD